MGSGPCLIRDARFFFSRPAEGLPCSAIIHPPNAPGSPGRVLFAGGMDDGGKSSRGQSKGFAAFRGPVDYGAFIPLHTYRLQNTFGKAFINNIKCVLGCFHCIPIHGVIRKGKCQWSCM